MTCSTLFGCTLFTELCGQDMRVNYHESSDCFEYPQKSLLKSSHPKKITCQIFPPKKILELIISNPPKKFNHPGHLKSGVTPPGSSINTIQK